MCIFTTHMSYICVSHFSHYLKIIYVSCVLPLRLGTLYHHTWEIPYSLSPMTHDSNDRMHDYSTKKKKLQSFFQLLQQCLLLSLTLIQVSFESVQNIQKNKTKKPTQNLLTWVNNNESAISISPPFTRNHRCILVQVKTTFKLEEANSKSKNPNISLIRLESVMSQIIAINSEVLDFMSPLQPVLTRMHQK